MKVIFLDIDGVIMPLGSHEYLRMDAQTFKALCVKEHPALADVSAYDLAAAEWDWYPRATKHIRQLVEQTQAKIVITSSWRIARTLHELQLLFSLHGLGDAVLDVTVDTGKKEEEIQMYLWGYPEIEQYVVIDDMDMRRSFHEHFIHVRDKYFTEENRDAALRILMQEDKREDDS